MHILLIHQAFAALDEPGGTRHHEMASYFATQGHAVTVIASPVSYLTGKTSSPPENTSKSFRLLRGEEVSDGGKVRILRAYTYPDLHRSFVHRVFSFLSFMLTSFILGLGVRDVDLVWGTSPPIFQGLTSWGLARLKGVPFVFEVRDLWPAFAVAVGVLRQPIVIRASEWLEGFLYRNADHVVVNSPGFIDHVKTRGAREVELVPNGADPRMFNPATDGSDFRRTVGLEEEFIVLYAGAHGISNDLGQLLKAANQLRDERDIAFVLLGDGMEKQDLQERARELNLDNVHFLPPVPKDEMAGVLAAADACVAILKPLMLYKTVYPNKVFDYMAAGRPVILAIDGVIREVVEAAQAGIFVTPGDSDALAEAIHYLARNPGESREMGTNGRQYIETHFDRARLAKNMLKLFMVVGKL